MKKLLNAKVCNGNPTPTYMKTAEFIEYAKLNHSITDVSLFYFAQKTAGDLRNNGQKYVNSII